MNHKIRQIAMVGFVAVLAVGLCAGFGTTATAGGSNGGSHGSYGSFGHNYSSGHGYWSHGYNFSYGYQSYGYSSPSYDYRRPVVQLRLQLQPVLLRRLLRQPLRQPLRQLLRPRVRQSLRPRPSSLSNGSTKNHGGRAKQKLRPAFFRFQGKLGPLVGPIRTARESG